MAISKFVFIVSLFYLVNGDIMRLDKWSILESTSIEVLESVFTKLKSSVFPDFSHSFEGFLFKNNMKIFNLRIAEIIPRYSFLNAIFYSDKRDTFAVSMPLGFHMTVEFTWTYNLFVIPISGTAKLDTDLYDLIYNTTITFSKENTDIKTHFDYQLIKVEEVETNNFINADSWIDASTKLLITLDAYFPLLYQRMGAIFGEVLPGIFKAHMPKSFLLTLYYPVFQVVENITLPLSNVTTRDALLYSFGNSAPLPESVERSNNVNRHYCVDSSLISRIIDDVFSLMNVTFHKNNSPKTAIYQISINGLSQLVPDIILEYPMNSTVQLIMTVPKDQSKNISILRLNDTNGLITNLPVNITFTIQNKKVLTLTLGFDIVVRPTAERRSGGYDFDLEILSAVSNMDSINVDTHYKTFILSNIQAATSEYLSYLFIPYIGHVMLGDGMVISDDISGHSRYEFSIVDSAICLNLIKIR